MRHEPTKTCEKVLRVLGHNLPSRVRQLGGESVVVVAKIKASLRDEFRMHIQFGTIQKQSQKQKTKNRKKRKRRFPLLFVAGDRVPSAFRGRGPGIGFPKEPTEESAEKVPGAEGSRTGPESQHREISCATQQRSVRRDRGGRDLGSQHREIERHRVPQQSIVHRETIGVCLLRNPVFHYHEFPVCASTRVFPCVRQHQGF